MEFWNQDSPRIYPYKSVDPRQINSSQTNVIIQRKLKTNFEIFSFKILSKNLLGLDFNLTIYNKALTPIYMFEIAGKTAGPDWLTFLWNPNFYFYS